MRTVVIGGGTGFIGTALRHVLCKNGYSVINVSRMPGADNMSWDDLHRKGLPKNTVAVVSLAGQNVLDPTRRWTAGFKQNVWNSRINTTTALAQAVLKANETPKTFISVTGVGVYPPSESAEYTEESKVEEFDFLSKLVIAWEAAARLPPEIGVRHVTIRPGVVLGRSGGMVKQLFLPFFLGVGGPMASGQQYLPWIYIADIAKLIRFSIENDQVRGILNGVSPQIIRNKDFAKAFAKAMWRPALFTVPKFALDLAFSKERAKMITEGQKVLPKRVLEYGFKYDYSDINLACKQCSKFK